jgi:hypothetical protein
MWDKMVAELEGDSCEHAGEATGITTNEYASMLGGKEATCASGEPIGLSDE